MDHPTPFPGKTQTLKPKTTRKITDASTRTRLKEPPFSRQKRVFGTVRCTNIQVKTVTEKAITKEPKSTTRKCNASINVTTDQVAKNNSPKKPGQRFKKKSIDSQEKVRPNLSDIRTPVASHSITESKVAGTPYHSANNCSKCRFDRLETASYWLGQIKLAESVGKHFVSVAFFRLAFDSNAEPIRNLRVELKRYIGRHEYLSYETEWKDVSRSYGILKDESNVGGENLKLGKGETTCSDFDQHRIKEGKEQEAV
ncbi:unnamed protein product [Dovyalis caffra]|uniref:Uncharacterized protein n=1 Tax=Dovyalis caffra TaxID=77055 RepID=A0AAV1S3F9_9ROSI|nr:unnamed protein product [Dovyalis caffra]